MTNTFKPIFSIVIPTYNHAHLISKCLQSVLNQTFVSWEVIVVNNYSEDNTTEVVSSFNDPRIRLVNYQNNGIIAASRNEGVRRSQGDFIAFLDSDDWWYAEKLAHVFAKTEKADVIHHDADIFTPSGKKILKMHGRQLKNPIFVDLITKGNPLITSGVCVRRSILGKTGLFSEDKALISVEDYDLWLRIALVSERFVHIPESLVAYWIWEGNISKSPEQYISTHSVLYNKFKGHLAYEDRIEAEKYLSYCVGIKKLSMDMYQDGRRLFFESLRSRNLSTIIRSGVRILISFLDQAASLLRSLKTITKKDPG